MSVRGDVMADSDGHWSKQEVDADGSDDVTALRRPQCAKVGLHGSTQESGYKAKVLQNARLKYACRNCDRTGIGGRRDVETNHIVKPGNAGAN